MIDFEKNHNLHVVCAEQSRPKNNQNYHVSLDYSRKPKGILIDYCIFPLEDPYYLQNINN